MSHIILAPQGVSQILFESLIADARRIAMHVRGETHLQEPATLEYKFARELSEFQAAFDAFLQARPQDDSPEALALYLDLYLEWADLAYYSLCHHYQLEYQALGTQSSLWYRTTGVLYGIIQPVRGLDAAVLKYDRRASGAPKDVAAERLLIAHLFPGTAHLSNR